MAAFGASDPLPSGPVKVGLLNRQSTLGSGNRATLYALIGPLPPRASNGEVGLKPAFAASQYGDVARKASRFGSGRRLTELVAAALGTDSILWYEEGQQHQSV